MSGPLRFARSLSSRLAGTAVLAAFVAACGGVGPDANNTNTSFSERLEVGGQDTFQFTVQKNGEFSVQLTALSNANAVLGIYVGQMGSGICNPIVGYVTPIAVLNRDALSSSITKGAYCLQVYDSGSLAGTVDYTVRVNHP